MPTKLPTYEIDPFTRDALIHAATSGDMEEIDKITDRLAQQGVCRARTDMSRMGEWISRRAVSPAFIHSEPIITAAGRHDIGSEIASQFRGIFAGAGR